VKRNRDKARRLEEFRKGGEDIGSNTFKNSWMSSTIFDVFLQELVV
ncbi:2820_t:CDS:1, partial [Funneliformis mosseae]